MRKYMKTKILILLVLVGGLISACGVVNSRFDSITITNKTVGTILPSEEPMSVFPRSNYFISVYARILNAKKGDQITGKILAVDAPEFDPSALLLGTNIDTMTIDKDYEDLQTGVDFMYPNGEWPIGSYKIEVYFNGKLDTVFKFTVK